MVHEAKLSVVRNTGYVRQQERRQTVQNFQY